MNILGCKDQKGDVEKYVLSLFCSKRFKSDEIRKLFSYEGKKTHILKGHCELYDRLLHVALLISSNKTQKYFRVRCHALVSVSNITLLRVVV